MAFNCEKNTCSDIKKLVSLGENEVPREHRFHSVVGALITPSCATLSKQPKTRTIE